MSSNNKKLLGIVYFIQGEINPTKVIVFALGIVIYNLQKKQSIISDYEKIRNAYSNEYNIIIPKGKIEKLVNENFIYNGTCYEIDKKYETTLEELSRKLLESKKKFNDKFNELLNNFFQFYSKTNKNIRKQECKAIFYRVILDNSDENEEYRQSENDSLRNSYLKYLLTNREDLYKLIENINIAQSIKEIPLEIYDFNYSNCCFFLDTPILMKYLGYDGIDYKKTYEKIFKQLKTLNVKFYLFEHTFEETWGILFSWKLAYERNNFTARGLDTYLQARTYYKEDYNSVIPLDREKLREIILNNEIEIKSKPELTEENCVYDESDLKKVFENKYKTTFSSYPDRILRDIDSIVGIQSVRKNNGIKNPSSYQGAKYFLLTDNQQLFNITKNNYNSVCNRNDDAIFCEVQCIEYIIYNLWEKNGKFCIPKELLKDKILISNTITDEFRQNFLALSYRLTKLNEKVDLVRLVSENPEILQKANDIYIENNKSIEKVIEFLEKSSKEKEKTSNYDYQGQNENNINYADKELDLKKQEEELMKKKNEFNLQKEEFYRHPFLFFIKYLISKIFHKPI